jgi:AcrR family transcriptional regulator
MVRTIKSLPRGRHGLSREQVSASQRSRLLKAAVDLGNERGFASLTLTDIVQCAGVARSTFYAHFTDKQQCFLEAFEYAADRVFEHVLVLDPLLASANTSPVDAYIARLLDLCLQEPGLVRLVAADVEALGPEAAQRQRATRDRLADGLVKLRNRLRRDKPALAPITRIRALAIVGAINEVVQHTFYTSGVGALPALRAELSTIMHALLEAPPARAAGARSGARRRARPAARR